jgi:hypothetical protein
MKLGSRKTNIGGKAWYLEWISTRKIHRLGILKPPFTDHLYKSWNWFFNYLNLDVGYQIRFLWFTYSFLRKREFPK